MKISNAKPATSGENVWAKNSTSGALYHRIRDIWISAGDSALCGESMERTASIVHVARRLGPGGTPLIGSSCPKCIEVAREERTVTFRMNLEDLTEMISDTITTAMIPHRAVFAFAQAGDAPVTMAPEKVAALLCELGNNLAAAMTGHEVESPMSNALRFAADKLEATGEAGTKSSATLLRQLAAEAA